MPRYQVRLSALAVVRQSVIVEADDEHDAITVALDEAESDVWEFEALSETDQIAIEGIAELD